MPRKRASPPPSGDRAALARTVRSFLGALGHDAADPAWHGTPERVAQLWLGHLVAGERADLGDVLGRGLKTRAADPVCLANLDVHLVCPHHLTVAFGAAHVAYVPEGRLAAFGRLADLVSACTARLVLQEDAGRLVVDALRTHLGAKAALCAIEATHPCHNVTRPRAHRSRALTWAASGPRQEVDGLRALVRAGMASR